MGSVSRALLAVSLIAGAIYLRDPPWVGGLTSGMRPWQEGPRGTRFRWTAGHASFFVPSTATAITIPLRAGFPSGDSRPTRVDVAVDDRWLATVELPDPAAWIRPTLPLPREHSSRRFRRIDLRVSRTVGQLNLGVQLGEMIDLRPQ